MSEPKLLPCPFCGGEATIHDAGDSGGPSYWSVQCGLCPAMLDKYYADGSEEATAAWNRRTPSPEQPGRPHGASGETK